MDQKEIEGFAKKLENARKINCPIGPEMKLISLEEALSIQEEVLKLRKNKGEIITGLKFTPPRSA